MMEWREGGKKCECVRERVRKNVNVFVCMREREREVE